MNLTLLDYIQGVENNTITPQEVIDYYVKRAHNDQYNAYLSVNDEYVQEHGALFATKPLAGAPIAVKDIIMTKGYTTTCASKALEKYVAPYSATCFQNLEKHGGLMIGKTNMDEFAMGSANENSAFGKAYNPHGTNRTPGGSSGGSAAAVAGDLCIAALGTDTGGSVREPASFCGVVGLKPTYGRVSRYGVQSMASSFDTIGTITKTVKDAQLLMQAIAGHDENDAQTVARNEDMLTRSAACEQPNLEGIVIAVPQEFLGEGLDPRIKKRMEESIEQLKERGAEVREVSLPTLPYALAMYYSLVMAETSTNMARFDGVKFGKQVDTHEYQDITEYYKAMRSESFGSEVKRRILMGTYILSAANYEGLYVKATKMRQKMQKDFDRVFQDHHVILGPTVPVLAWKFGDKAMDPLTMYLADIYSVVANLAGLPAISVPVGTINDEGEDMPVGLQLMAPQWREDLLFHVGSHVEKTTY